MKDQAICRRKPLVLIASSLPFPTPTRELMRSIPRGDNRIFDVAYSIFVLETFSWLATNTYFWNR